MNILFFVSSMHAGGAERVAATLANAWARRGDTVTLVCCYNGHGTCFYPLDERVRLLWLAEQFPRLRWAGPLKKLVAIRQVARECRPDVMVSFLTNVNVTVLLATRGLPGPLVVCERTDPAWSTNLEPIFRTLRRWTYPWASRVLTQTPQAAVHLRQVAARVTRVSAIPNPLPPDLPAARMVESAEGGRHILLAMGRFNPVKQFDLLLDVFAGLAQAHPDWDLVIWGDGDQREALCAQVKRLGLEGRASLPGRTEQPWREMLGAHAFVLSSRVEGFPNAMLEAMALGLPCVALDCPSGPREISENGQVASLVAPGESDALAAALAQVMGQTPAWRTTLGARGADSVRARYGLDAVLQRWDEVLCVGGAQDEGENKHHGAV